MNGSLHPQDAQQIPPVCACCRCGDELYDTDLCYLIEEEVICPSCLSDIAQEDYASCRITAGELRCPPVD